MAMAVTNEGEKKEVPSSDASSFSFKLTSKGGTKILNSRPNSFNVGDKLNEDEVDYIVSAEGRKLKSSSAKKKPSQLVIPLIQKNKWRISNFDDLEKEAAEEIIKSLEDEENGESDKDFSIPILMRNKLPSKKDDTMADEMHDVSMRPEQSTMEDYESIPISAFGTAMLRGMGWSEGKPIGLNTKGLVEPIEYIPRYKGLGLGAEKRMPPNQKKRKRKLGDEKVDEKRYTPIVEKDGRVRHVKGIGEEVTQRPEGFFPGAFIKISKGVHKDLYGKIISVDEDNARLSVKLAISGEVVEFSQHISYLVDEDTFTASASQNRKETSKKDMIMKKEKEIIEYDMHSDSDTSEPGWIVPGIRVRIISKSYRHGKCYNKKVRILDVVSRSICTCQSDEKNLLEDVWQKDLETVIPKSKGAYVMVLRGKYKRQLGKLMERDKRKCTAMIQLTSNKHITNISYDDLSEYVGELPDDEFL